MRLSTRAGLLAAAVLSLAGAVACSSPSGSSDALDFNGLADALRSGGATVATGGAVQQPFFSVAGRILVVNGEDVQVFEYGDPRTAEADAGRVSPDGSAVGTTLVTWIGPPHFFRRDSVVAIYVGSSPGVLSALSSALGPQFAGR